MSVKKRGLGRGLDALLGASHASHANQDADTNEGEETASTVSARGDEKTLTEYADPQRPGGC